MALSGKNPLRHQTRVIFFRPSALIRRVLDDFTARRCFLRQLTWGQADWLLFQNLNTGRRGWPGAKWAARSWSDQARPTCQLLPRGFAAFNRVTAAARAGILSSGNHPPPSYRFALDAQSSGTSHLLSEFLKQCHRFPQTNSIMRALFPPTRMYNILHKLLNLVVSCRFSTCIVYYSIVLPLFFNALNKNTVYENTFSFDGFKIQALIVILKHLRPLAPNGLNNTYI